MNTETHNIFTLRFFDNDITPESFTAKELGKLISLFEDAIKSIIDSSYPNSDSSKVRICLTAIENKSESLQISVIDQNDVPSAPSAVVDFGRAVNNDTYTKLPEKGYQGARHIIGIVQEKNCKSELKSNQEKIYQIQSDKELIKLESVITQVDTTIYGTILKIGGEKPRVWLQTSEENIINFSIAIEHAQELSPLLYKYIGLKGKAKWDLSTDSIIGFKLYDILTYRQGNTSKAIKHLRSITSGYWDLFNTNDDINKELRKD